MDWLGRPCVPCAVVCAALWQSGWVGGGGGWQGRSMYGCCGGAARVLQECGGVRVVAAAWGRAAFIRAEGEAGTHGTIAPVTRKGSVYNGITYVFGWVVAVVLITQMQ